MVVPRPALLESTGAAPFTLLPGARVIVAGPGAESVGRLLRAALATDCLRELAVVHEPPGFGDIAIVIAGDEGPAPHPAECYTLEVAPEGVRIGAATAAGAFWGVQTLRQLVPPAREGDPLTVDAVRISDFPRVAHRGAMLDAARHFAVGDVKRFIDAIVRLKVNHLHLQLPDDPSRGGTCTADEYRELVAYAAERHVTIVPEIGEAPVRTETIPSIEHGEELVFKRLAAAAEKGWSSAALDTVTG